MAVTKDETRRRRRAHLAPHGFEKDDVDEIASNSASRRRRLYQHFEDQAGRVRVRLRAHRRESRAQLAASVAGEGSCRDKVLKLLRMILVQARGRVVRMGDDLRGEHVVAASACAEAYGSLLEDLLEKGRVQGEFAITSPALAQRMVAAMLNEYSLMLSENLKLKRDEELVAAIARFLG